MKLQFYNTCVIFSVVNSSNGNRELKFSVFVDSSCHWKIETNASINVLDAQFETPSSGASLLVRVCSIINVSYTFNENNVIHLYVCDQSINRRVMKKIQCIIKNHGQLLRFNNVYTVEVFDEGVHS